MECKTVKLPRSMVDSLTRQAVKDLAKKMSLEPAFSNKLKRFFKKVSREAKQYFIETGAIMPLTAQRKEMTKMLLGHYIVVYNAFAKNLRIKKSNVYSLETKVSDIPPTDENIDEQLKDQAIQDSIDRAERQSYYIITTTAAQLSASYIEAINASPIVGTEESTIAIANSATESFNEKSSSRPTDIATTETQSVSEYAKMKEANSIAYNISSSTTGSIETAPAQSFDPLQGEDLSDLKGYTVKIWVTMADNLVRDAHVAAEGQVQFLDEPFDVMGEALMIPGDTSLGASPGNVINCRCTAVYQTIE